jgi:protein subunit release factor A
MLSFRSLSTRQPEYSPEEFSRANKELRKLRDSMLLINDLRAKQKEIDGLKSLVSESSDDKDMLDLAVGELDEAVEEEKRLQTLLLKSLLPKDEADERDCILEVLVVKRLLCLPWTYSECKSHILLVEASILLCT